MAGFQKAKPMQAALKLGMYGPPGSGKTFTALLIAEGLAATFKRRIAYIDTERGTDFYAQAVARSVHPAAFDFDAIYSRSLTDIAEAVEGLGDEHGVVIIDSISHIWDAAMAAYAGKRTSNEGIPMHAWGTIKKPYKQLMATLLSMPQHVIICGRQKNEFGSVDGELTKVGVAMRAEGETAYEPHVTIRMEATRPGKPGEVADILAIIEKDRTGLLAGQVIVNPTFATIAKPMLGLLGGEQAQIQTEDEVGAHDAEVLADQEASKAKASEDTMRRIKAELDMASVDGSDALEKASKKITPAIKKTMLAAHVAELRDHYRNLAAKFAGRRIVTDEEAA